MIKLKKELKELGLFTTIDNYGEFYKCKDVYQFHLKQQEKLNNIIFKKDTEINILKGLLRSILDYNEGNNEYDFSKLNDRDNESFDAWMKLKDQIKLVLEYRIK